MLFILFVITELYFLIPAVIAQTFIPIVEIVIPTRIAIVEAKISKMLNLNSGMLLPPYLSLKYLYVIFFHSFCSHSK